MTFCFILFYFNVLTDKIDVAQLFYFNCFCVILFHLIALFSCKRPLVYIFAEWIKSQIEHLYLFLHHWTTFIYKYIKIFFLSSVKTKYYKRWKIGNPQVTFPSKSLNLKFSHQEQSLPSVVTWERGKKSVRLVFYVTHE